MSLINVGATTHYSISWDNDPNPIGTSPLTQADGPEIGLEQLLNICEQDYNLMADMVSRPFSTI